MTRSCTRAELYLLCLSAFCLPIFEAPKNVGSLSFVLLWFLLSFRKQRWGIPPSHEGLIVGLAAISLISSWLSPMSTVQDALRWTLLSMFVIAAGRLTYSLKQVAILTSALLIGHIIAVGESFWIWIGSQNIYPEFRSVGHVNHSVMYSNVALGVGLAGTLAKQRSIKIIATCSVCSALAYWVPSLSIVGGATMLAIAITASMIWSYYTGSLKAAALLLGVTAIFLVLFFTSNAGAKLTGEFYARLEAGDFFAGRDKILNSALAVWKLHPIIGTGSSSFGDATSETAVRDALSHTGAEYSASTYLHTSHGHNLWTTNIIERGLLGVILVTTLLAHYVRDATKWIIATRHEYTEHRWLAVVMLLVTVGFAIGGLGNTTMMNEHGSAGMMIIAVSSAFLRSIIPEES